MNTEIMSEETIEETTGILENIIQNDPEKKIKESKTFLNNLGKIAEKAVPDLIFAAIVFVVGFFVIKLLLLLFSKALNRTKIEKTAKGFLHSGAKVVLYVILAIIVLSVLNVPMSSIITVLGTCGLAIVLALKDSLSNVAGGILILLSKPLTAGDSVEIDGQKGIVREVNILYTTLTTFDNTTVHIPNKNILDGEVINFSEKDTRRIDMQFGVSYDTNIERAKNLMLKLCAENPDILKDPAPVCEVSEYGSSAIILNLQPWVKTENYLPVFYKINNDIKKMFDENGIEMPFDQIDIHTK